MYLAGARVLPNGLAWGGDAGRAKGKTQLRRWPAVQGVPRPPAPEFGGGQGVTGHEGSRHGPDEGQILNGLWMPCERKRPAPEVWNVQWWWCGREFPVGWG